MLNKIEEEEVFIPIDKKRILVAEDVTINQIIVRQILEEWGHEVVLVANGKEAFEAHKKSDFDLILMDIHMPEVDGYEATQMIRQMGDTTKAAIPIVALTANAFKKDTERFAEAGFNDYITKPFSIEVLMLRIENILKRTQKNSATQAPKESFEIGKFLFDYKNQRLIIDQNTTEMTQKEAELLRLFCLHKNNTVERDTILNLIWGDDTYFNGRSLDVFISRLRKYLKADADVEISNIHGVGFRLSVNN
jgi:DNA-binding response OmpR family regulator